MILDGYNWATTIMSSDERRVSMVYRPMLSRERRQYIALLGSMADWTGMASTEFPCEWLGRHVVAIEPYFSIKELAEDDRSLFLEAQAAICGVSAPSTDPDWASEWERLDVENLRSGVVLALRHPRLDRRSCEQCVRYWYDDGDGGDGQLITLDGKPVIREDSMPPPCRTAVGCPVGTPESPKRLSSHNREAYKHFQSCEATGTFPDDEIVKRNAIVIRQAIQAARRQDDGQRLRRTADAVVHGFGPAVEAVE